MRKIKVTINFSLLCFFVFVGFVLSSFNGFSTDKPTVLERSDHPSGYGWYWPGANLSVDDHGNISSADVDILFDLYDVAILKFLDVLNTAPNTSLRMGFDEEVVYGDRYLLPEGTRNIELMLSDRYEPVDWSTVQLAINDSLTVTLGDFEMDSLNTEWNRVVIPLEAFQSGGIDRVQLITFLQSEPVNYAFKEIKFTGGVEDFVWFGRDKYDNAIKATTDYRLYRYVNPPTMIEAIKLKILNQNREIVQTVMPYKSISAVLSPGENKMVGILVGDRGEEYYTDTLTYTVSAGIMAQVTDVSCAGASDGEIKITVDGGTPPYSYNWAHGPTSKDLSGLSAGIYTLTVTDANGKTDATSVKVEEPVDFSATLEPDFECNGFMQIFGGTAPYYYAFDDGDFQPFDDNEDFDKVWEVKTGADPASPNPSMATAIKTDRLDNTYVAGNYYDVLNIHGQSIGYPGNRGIFLAKFDTRGTLLWSISSESSSGVWDLRDMAVSDGGDVYVAFYSPGGTVHTATGTFTLAEGDYLARFTSSGSYFWLEEVPTGVSQIGLDGLDNVYVTGSISSNFFRMPEFEEIIGATDLYLAQYTSMGQFQWAEHIEGKNGERVMDMAVATDGDVYLTGAFRTDISFHNLTLNSSGYDDMFVVKFNAIGAVMWARKGGGTANYDVGTALALDKSGKLYVAALFGSTDATFGGTDVERQAIIASLDAYSGNTLWQKKILDILRFPGVNRITEMVLDKDGNLQATGSTQDEIIYDNEGRYVFYDGGFVLSLSSTGEFIKRKDLAFTPYYYKAYTIAAGKNNHVIYADYDGEFSIRRAGAEQQSYFNFGPAKATVTVKDSRGCMVTLNVPDSGPFTYIPSICHVTAAPQIGVKLFWETEDAGSIDHYNIYRETTALGDYELIGAGTIRGVFYDSLADTQKRSYRYRISSVDHCGNETSLSSPHKTMHLTVNEGNKGQVNLIWDRYEGFDYPSFQIYRGPSPDEMEFLDEVPADLYTYTDLNPPLNSLYYQIRIEQTDIMLQCGLENGSDSYGRMAGEKVVIGSNITTRFGIAGNLTFYPNPAHDHINLKFSPDGDEYQLKVLDAGGRVVRTLDGIFDKAVIERGDLPAGIYHIVLTKDSGKPLYGRIAFE